MRILCNPAIFRTWGIFRILSSIYGAAFFKEPCVALTYLEPWYIQNLRNIDNPLKHLRCNFIFNEPWHICDEVFYSEPFVTITYLDFWYIQNLSIFRTQDIRYHESLNYSSLHRTLCNLDIFITYIYSTTSMLRTCNMVGRFLRSPV